MSDGPHSSANPHWYGSAMPFFVRIKDQSSYESSGISRDSRTSSAATAESSSHDNQQQHSHHSQTDSTSREKQNSLASSFIASSGSNGSFTTTEIYPQVHYVFADDDFDPTVDILDTDPNEVSIVLDFNDTGDKVVGYKSFSDSWQVTDVKVSSSSQPASQSPWVGQGTDETTSIIDIEGTSARIKTNNVNSAQELITMFESRLDQLKKVLEAGKNIKHEK